MARLDKPQKQYSELLDKPIVFIVVDEGSYSSIFNTSLDPRNGVQCHDVNGNGVQDEIGYPVSRIEVVYVPGEAGYVPWFNVYMGDTLVSTFNRNYVRQVSYMGHLDFHDLFTN